jgi:gluconokinase
MGVSGCGKSTVGRALAARLGVPFAEGDELHPPRNIALMSAGTPLTDADRGVWLDRVADVLERAAQQGGIVVSCSALKRRYRDRLREAAPALRFVYLHGSETLLAERMAARSGHYMPASLLTSQLETLEPPGADERPIALDIAQDTPALVEQAVAQIKAVNA